MSNPNENHKRAQVVRGNKIPTKKKTESDSMDRRLLQTISNWTGIFLHCALTFTHTTSVELNVRVLHVRNRVQKREPGRTRIR